MKQFDLMLANLANRIQGTKYNSATKTIYLRALNSAVESNNQHNLVCTYHAIDLAVKCDLTTKHARFFTLSTRFRFTFNITQCVMLCDLKDNQEWNADFITKALEFSKFRFDPVFMLNGIKHCYIVWYDPVLDLISLKYTDDSGGYRVMSITNLKESILCQLNISA